MVAMCQGQEWHVNLAQSASRSARVASLHVYSSDHFIKINWYAQLFSAASPNQVFYNTKVEEKTTGPSAMARLGNPVAHLSGWCRCGSG